MTMCGTRSFLCTCTSTKVKTKSLVHMDKHFTIVSDVVRIRSRGRGRGRGRGVGGNNITHKCKNLAIPKHDTVATHGYLPFIPDDVHSLASKSVTQAVYYQAIV